MENNETTFYLGEKKEEPEPIDNPYKKDPVISYGGEMPLVFCNEEYVPLTNDEIANKRILSELLEKKNMINRRMLYLENKRMELLGYSMKIEKEDSGKGIRGFAKFMLIFSTAAVLLILKAMREKGIAFMVAVIFAVTYLFMRVRYQSEDPSQKLEELDRKMTDMEEEHRKLELEKEKLLERIEEFKKAEKE